MRRQRLLPLLVVAATVLFIYVTYQADWTSDAWYACRSEDFAATLARVATPDRFVVLALVDTAFADMAVNLVESSLRPNGIDNFLLVGAGRKACEILLNASLPCFHYVEDKDTEVASTYKSADFNRKMNIRTDMILDALNAGFTVLHTDLDVVFLGNPLPELKTIMLNADIAALWDSVAFNAGFTVIKPTWFSRKIYERMRAITRFSPKTDDQMALNLAIQRMTRIYKNRGFNAVALDKNRYLCGLEYFERGDRLFPSNCTDCVVVHNNWIVSREAKVYRFKEHLMWFNDRDAYYTNPSQGYLTYENPVVWNDEATSIREELDALAAALAYGALLNRVVILPRFHCLPAAVKATTKKRKQKKTDAVTDATLLIPKRECPLNSILNITAFDALFADLYRESSFLQHPLVSDEVKRGQSEPHRVLTASTTELWARLNLTADFDDDVRVVPSSAGASVTSLTADDVQRSLSMDKRVLRFHSLYRATPEFRTSKEQEVFNARVKAAFQRSNYRQLEL